jgi:hypothetical protein
MHGNGQNVLQEQGKPQIKEVLTFKNESSTINIEQNI